MAVEGSLFHHFAQHVRIGHVCLEEVHGDAGDLAQAIKHGWIEIREVVEQGHFMPGFKECYSRVAPDVAGAAGKQDSHVVPLTGMSGSLGPAQ